MNVLVIHDMEQEEEVMVYELQDDEGKALEQAKKMFEEDVLLEKKEGNRLDQGNTWWDESGYGQIAWLDSSRATYNVTYTSEYKNRERKETEKEIEKALDKLNIKWSREDLETVLEDAGIPVTDENLVKLCKQIGNGFREMLITDVFQRLNCLV